jgi:hypothetical protein
MTNERIAVTTKLGVTTKMGAHGARTDSIQSNCYRLPGTVAKYS